MVSWLSHISFIKIACYWIFLAYVTCETTFRCFPKNDTTPLDAKTFDAGIGLQVTNRGTHQIMSRIFYIFLNEKLNYTDVKLIPINSTMDSVNSWKTLDLVRRHPSFSNRNMINLEVWMHYTAYRLSPENISDAGASITPGRFGWFVPKTQISSNNDSVFSLHYEVFKNINNIFYKLYVMDEDVIENLLQKERAQNYESLLCRGKNCATIIAEYRNDSNFLVNQIEETKSFLNIIWLDSNFRESIEQLLKYYNETYPNGSKRLIILHWTPSEIINANNEFAQITMPRCEDYRTLEISDCKYEMTSILKYYYTHLQMDRTLMHALRHFFLSDNDLLSIQRDLISQRKIFKMSDDIYNHVACNWLRKNENTFRKWLFNDPSSNSTITLIIGGIFPINMTGIGHDNIIEAVQQAIIAVNNNKTVLPSVKLQLMINNDECKSDMAMKALIHYFNVPYMLGVLGPACSETIEPIAGISKHMNMLVMSYSAEGGSFKDRVTYPTFFRTIGSNNQYGDAFMEIMKKLQWKRIAALIEDGQKYTEYVLQMKPTFKLKGMTLFQELFRSDVIAADIKEHLLELKNQRIKIIIADVNSRYAAMIICESIKLKMTYREDYVWFLPSWISKDFLIWQNLINNSCSANELRDATEYHLSIMHTPFGKKDSLMQERKTIGEWLSLHKYPYGTSFSNYVGFAYDAVWAYAIAAHKLLAQDQNAYSLLRSSKIVNQLSKLMWETDFNGLSGRVRFGEGGARIANLDIMQWRNCNYIIVGNFRPAINGIGSNMRTKGGNLFLNLNNIHWFRDNVPLDGTYDCRLASIARIFNMNCDGASMTFSIILCFVVVTVVSIISFLFWKYKYVRKLEHSAKIMKTFGIDLLSPSQNNSNTLDKWEIPKEKVILNRRLGEGAFGTVYGGEAQLSNGEWKAVAVKTLKTGASVEDRLDFLTEAEAMKRFDHKNIIKLLAVCLQSEPIYTVMEFMLYGDLRTFLLARRNMLNEKMLDETDISSKSLTRYAMDVVRGLAYLSEQKYVHRDLACRNCLVNAQRTVKIGDFGMARPTFERDYYRFNRKGMLPVRWMAPEALALGLFTPASDIWAFGILLFEMISFGSYPYQGLTNNEVLEYVKSGKTLKIPLGIKPQLEGLLRACWNKDAAKRPTALEVIEYISNYPRLLTPTLDYPSSAIEMPQREEDELEILRKMFPPNQSTVLDILSQPNSSIITNPNAMNLVPNLNTLELLEYGEESKIPASLRSNSILTADGYSIMCPLLVEHNNSNKVQENSLSKKHSDLLTSSKE